MTWGCVGVFLYCTGLEDYIVTLNGAIVLPALGVIQCINVTVINDDVREPNETLILQPEPYNPLDEVVGVEQFTIVIIDDGDGEYME